MDYNQFHLLEINTLWLIRDQSSYLQMTALIYAEFCLITILHCICSLRGKREQKWRIEDKKRSERGKAQSLLCNRDMHFPGLFFNIRLCFAGEIAGIKLLSYNSPKTAHLVIGLKFLCDNQLVLYLTYILTQAVSKTQILFQIILPQKPETMAPSTQVRFLSSILLRSLHLGSICL